MRLIRRESSGGTVRDDDTTRRLLVQHMRRTSYTRVTRDSRRNAISRRVQVHSTNNALLMPCAKTRKYEITLQSFEYFF